MMAGLGDAAQIDRILVLVADGKADQIDVKGAAFAEVLHVQHGMTGARDVEGRMVVGLGDGHGGLQSVTNHGRDGSKCRKEYDISPETD